MKSILSTSTKNRILAIACFSLIAFMLPALARRSTAQSGAWTTRTPMPTARSAFGVGEVNGVLYAVGGSTARPYVQPLPDSTSGVVEAYDATTDSWTTKASMPTPRANLGVGVVNGIVFAVGGQHLGGTILSTVEAYDPATDTWTTKAPMPTARYGLGVAVVGGVLYAVGGVGADGSSVLPTLEAYNAANDTWTTRASMPTARYLLGAAALNGKLYALGGINQSVVYATVEAYDPGTNTWTTRAPMTGPRGSFGVNMLNGQIYVAGGGNGIVVLATAEAYNPTTDTWQAIAPMSTARYYPGAGSAIGNFYVIGGTTDDINAFSIVEAFTPATPHVGPPNSKDQCKDGGWQKFDTPRKFKNQGDCIQFVNTGK
jgi:N-acetylneuraminic acid mutarotase